MILSPLPVQRFYSNIGLPLVGGKLFTYIAGTSTKTATYKDSSGSAINTNPVILNFRGECDLWLDAAVTYKFVLAGPFDSDPPTNPIWSVDNIPGAMAQSIFDALYGNTPDHKITPAEIAAGVVPVNRGYPPGWLRRYGGVIDGVTDDTAAWVAAIKVCNAHPTFWDGTSLIDSTTELTPPAGGTVYGIGPKSIIKRTSGTADIFQVLSHDNTFSTFRMEGPNNTACDGIIAEGVARLKVLHVQGYQLSTTVTAGDTLQCTDVECIGVFSDSNTQQGILFNRVDRGIILGCISQLVGTSELHHGYYIGHVTRVLCVSNIARGCAGSGINVFSQDSFALRRVVVAHNSCDGNGTVGSGNRAGILVARDSTSSLQDVLVIGNVCHNNGGFNIYAENCDDCDILDNNVDGNALTTTNGIIVTSTHSGITCRVRVKNNRIRGHGSGIRISASAATTLQMEVDENELESNTTGIFADGAGTRQIRLGRANRFRNNSSDMTGTFLYEILASNISTMAGGENFLFRDGPVFIKDTGGANRIFNPSGTFPFGYQVTLVNTGANTINFDSGGLNQAVTTGQRGIFTYNGTAWMKVFTG